MTENTHAGRLIVLTGPTAVGKGTVEAKLRADHPEVWVSVSATTRDPRPGEVNGVNYWFLSEDEFLAKEQAGEFLETAVVHRMAHYGTLLKPVEEHLAAARWTRYRMPRYVPGNRRTDGWRFADSCPPGWTSTRR